MSKYIVNELSNGLWRIRDNKGDVSYLIEGSKSALLIDTAVCDEPIIPIVRTLTDKPVSLALTHAHVDHMYRCDEFPTVYLHEKEINDWKRGNGFIMTVGTPLFRVKWKKYDVKTFIPLYDGSKINLGNFDVTVIRLSGHTYGSVMFVDSYHKVVFCGDAVGHYLWLFLPFSTSIKEYKEELVRVKKELAPFADYKFLGGHCNADGTVQSVLTIETFSDMSELCDKILKGTADVQKVKQLSFLSLLYAEHGSAGIVFRKCKLKSS